MRNSLTLFTYTFILLLTGSCGTDLFAKEKIQLPDQLQSVIGNPGDTSSDGRLIIGFTPNVGEDGLIRGAAWRAVYEGDQIPEKFYTK